MSDPVRYEKDGGIVTLTLNEPRTRNAISPAIVEAMVDCINRINADLSVGCVIVTGAGTGFSSGGNVKVREEARPLARRIAAQPVHSLRLTKRLLRDSQQISLPIALEMASSMQ